MAAKGLNKVLLIGHLGKPPEMKFTAGGKAVTTFTVAVNRPMRTDDGERGEETEWFRVVAWEKLAETCNQYLQKGSRVYLEGRLQTRSWEADGQTHYRTEVVAQELIMLDGRREDRPTVPQRDWEPASGPAPVGVGEEIPF